jgi:hypothetical protein
MSVKFSEKEIRFLNYMLVGRLATTDGEAIHLVLYVPFSMEPSSTWPRTRKPVRLEIFARTTRQLCLLINTPRTGCVTWQR